MRFSDFIFSIITWIAILEELFVVMQNILYVCITFVFPCNYLSFQIVTFSQVVTKLISSELVSCTVCLYILRVKQLPNKRTTSLNYPLFLFILEYTSNKFSK